MPRWIFPDLPISVLKLATKELYLHRVIWRAPYISVTALLLPPPLGIVNIIKHIIERTIPIYIIIKKKLKRKLNEGGNEVFRVEGCLYFI